MDYYSPDDLMDDTGLEREQKESDERFQDNENNYLSSFSNE